MFIPFKSRLQFQEIHRALSAQDDILFSKDLKRTEQLRNGVLAVSSTKMLEKYLGSVYNSKGTIYHATVFFKIRKCKSYIKF